MSNKLLEKYGLYIDGKWQDASNGATFEAKSPIDGTHLALCAEATEQDVNEAVCAAWKAFESWKKTTPAERSDILYKIADVIEENKEWLAEVETRDNGKPIRETLAIDIPYSVEHFRYFAGCILAEEGQASVLNETFLSLILREPIGVVGQIVPWNFPFLMAAWKLAPVIAAGDCTVFKPSSATSLSVLEFARLTDGILPKGVFNVITGSGSKAGQYILEHKGFRKLAFTGSTEVGRTVGLAAADRIIPSTLELGGKSANIFFDDCDFDQAIDGAQLGILFNQGQVCCAGSRIFVQDTFYDKFVAALTKAFNGIKVGDPLNPETQMGSQINRAQLKKILDYIDIGKAEGATVACGGVKVDDGELEKGSFMRPTLLTNVTNKMRVAQEEIFGPVACVIKFHDEQEVVKMANDSVYGLGGAVWTKDIARAIRVARNIETGRMWINTYNQIPAHSPFGGYKESGIGRETHKMILEHYTQKKNIMINLNYDPSGFYPKKY
ncbi:MAG: aldehyde dehydrogenase family protein [Ruminococcaceae bacterium]|jgi:acyl-CoA reductase-like NAD-dependent aldehyde dehydrogenase|nr:aldehyde dehydrogenase family protein [Oscillospiraceae bacterium]